MRAALLAVAVAVALVLLLPAAAPAAARDCGSISVSGTSTRIVVLRAVSCDRARQVARRYARLAVRRLGRWACALAHRPLRRIDGRYVAFACGRGRRRGDIATWPHAFVGTVARRPHRSDARFTASSRRSARAPRTWDACRENRTSRAVSASTSRGRPGPPRRC
jgi:hypothetical protein